MTLALVIEFFVMGQSADKFGNNRAILRTSIANIEIIHLSTLLKRKGEPHLGTALVSLWLLRSRPDQIHDVHMRGGARRVRIIYEFEFLRQPEEPCFIEKWPFSICGGNICLPPLRRRN